jgi:RNA polymerase sigma-70 factor (ECF subfamily)
MDTSEQQRIFCDWLSRHRGLLFKVVHSYAFTPHDREDLFQQIATEVWNSTASFRRESAETTWLYRVALFVAMAWSKGERRHHERRESVDTFDLLLRPSPDVEDERLPWLYEKIATLDPIDRSLTLLLLDGFSYQEMAKLLGISESNVGVKVHRIKARLIEEAQEESSHGF